MKFLKVLFAVAALTVSTFAQAPLQYRVDDVPDLLAITLYGANAKVTAWVGGLVNTGDGLGGMFFYEGANGSATNVYAIYKPNNNNGRWLKLPTSVAYQDTPAVAGTDTSYAWKLLRSARTNFFGIGADNNSTFLQTFNSKVLRINPTPANPVTINEAGGPVGIGLTTPAATRALEVYSTNALILSRFYNQNLTAGHSGLDVLIGSADAGDFPFKVRSNDGSTTLITTTGTGLTGFGVATPTSLVSVGGELATATFVSTNSVKIGGTGATVKAIYSAAADLDFPNIVAYSQTNLTITVTGAGTNSTVQVSAANATGITAGVALYQAWVSATNTVTVTAGNNSAADKDPAALAVRVTVTQY